MADDRSKPLQNAVEARGSNLEIGHTERYSTKAHLGRDVNGRKSESLFQKPPVRVAPKLRDSLPPSRSRHLIADYDYDSDVIIEKTISQGILRVIHHKKNKGAAHV